MRVVYSNPLRGCKHFTLFRRIAIMRSKRLSNDEAFRLIMECRRSGLPDYQWCQMNDINPATFYNWVSRLRKGGMQWEWNNILAFISYEKSIGQQLEIICEDNGVLSLVNNVAK